MCDKRDPASVSRSPVSRSFARERKVFARKEDLSRASKRTKHSTKKRIAFVIHVIVAVTAKKIRERAIRKQRHDAILRTTRASHASGNLSLVLCIAFSCCKN